MSVNTLDEVVEKVLPKLQLWFEPGQRTELRILQVVDRETQFSHTEAGFFDYDKLHRLIRIGIGSFEGRAKGAYFVLNPIKHDVKTEKRFNGAIQRAKKEDLTSDEDIIERRWLLIDADPVRPPGISSDDEEKRRALETAAQVREYIQTEFGVLPTIELDSGNGYHLYYRLAEPIPVVLPLAENDVIKETLRHLVAKFDCPEVKIDRSVFNPSRIVKLVGSRSCKGTPTEGRPHRRAKLLASNPDARLPLDSLARMAALAPPIEAPARRAAEPVKMVGNRGKLLECAAKYVAAMDPAISGQGGSDQTYHTAAILRVGFDLSFDEAWPILSDYNERCAPPWTDTELEKKLNDAANAPGVRGERIPEFLRAESTKFGKRMTVQGTTLPTPLASQPAPKSKPKFTNFELDDVLDGDTTKQIKKPRSAAAILADLTAITGGWPKCVGRSLFTQGPGYEPIFFATATELFAWASVQVSNAEGDMNWARGDNLLTKEEFFAAAKLVAERYESIERFPHEPPMPGVYYMHPEIPESTGEHLAELMREFSPSTWQDSILIRAFFCSLFWGGPVGCRPAWLFCAEENDVHGGRGVGKTTIAEMAGELLNGYLTLSPNSEERDVQSRLLSPSALSQRLVLFDNLKSLHLSSSLLESLLTIGRISGRALYIGEASRPNNITWVLTFNEPSFSKDLAQRCVMVRLARPDYDPGWRQRVIAHIAEHRWGIVADCLALLRQEKRHLEKHSRWAVWEAEVLAKMAQDTTAIDSLIETIGSRAVEVDDDDMRAMEISEIIQNSFRSNGFDPDTDRVRIYSGDLARIINNHMKRNDDATRVSRFVNSLHIPEMIRFRTSTSRGFVWTPKGGGERDVTFAFSG